MKGKSYDYKAVIDLTDEEVKKLTKQGIIGDTLLKVVAEKKVNTPPAPPGTKPLTQSQKDGIKKLVDGGMSEEEATKKVTKAN